MEKKGGRKERKEEREGYERRQTAEAGGGEHCLEMETKRRGKVGELVNDLASCLAPGLCEPGLPRRRWWQRACLPVQGA